MPHAAPQRCCGHPLSPLSFMEKTIRETAITRMYRLIVKTSLYNSQGPLSSSGHLHVEATRVEPSAAGIWQASALPVRMNLDGCCHAIPPLSLSHTFLPTLPGSSEQLAALIGEVLAAVAQKPKHRCPRPSAVAYCGLANHPQTTGRERGTSVRPAALLWSIWVSLIWVF